MNRIKITRREDLPGRKAVIIRICAVLLSLVCAGLVMLAFGLNPIEIYKEIISGSLGTPIRIRQTVIKAIPLVITSLGILIAFKMKFWNIGGEGQIVMGAAAATLVALNLGFLPGPPLLFLMALASMAAGGLWAFVPAYFKAKMGTNETIFTLMMNYIAIKFVTYLQYGPWKDPAAQGFPKIPAFPPGAVLPQLFQIHIGWVAAVALVVLVHFFINHTKKGYEITVVGESVETARYAGMNIKSIILTAMFFFRRPLRAYGNDPGLRH